MHLGPGRFCLRNAVCSVKLWPEVKGHVIKLRLFLMTSFVLMFQFLSLGSSSLRSMCCSLFLQAVGEKKAEAVATVVAAVDLARVRKPVLEEGDRAEEDEAVDMKEQEATPADKPAQATKTASEEQRRVQVQQVQQVQRWTEVSSHEDSGVSSSTVPHFTVSKVSVPKHEPSHEVRGSGPDPSYLPRSSIPSLTSTCLTGVAHV